MALKRFSLSMLYLLLLYFALLFTTSLAETKGAKGRMKRSLQYGQTTESNSTYDEIPEELSGGSGSEDRLESSSSELESERLSSGSEELSCSNRSSCQSVDSMIPYSFRKIKDRNCYCDDLCMSYDDCCQDYERHLPSSVEIIHLEPEVISCQQLRMSFEEYEKFHVVNRCPINYSNTFISDMCELEDSELFNRLPVNGNTSKILYRNYYCAICNGDHDVIFWTVEFHVCNPIRYKEENGQNANSNNITEELFQANSNCEQIFHDPIGNWPRSCKEVIRKCEDSWTDVQIARECEDRSQLTSYLYDRKGNVFRNKACAVCNSLHETDTSCYDPTPLSEVRSGMEVELPSYAILIDLNSETLVLRAGRRKQSETTLRECDIGSVYDPFASVCRPIYCSKGHILTETGCVQTADSVELRRFGGQVLGQYNKESELDPGMQLNCSHAIRLNQSEYTIFDNQSVYVHHLNQFYERDQYFYSPPNIFICSPFTSRQYNTTIYEQVLMFNYDKTQSLLSLVGVIISLLSLLILFIVYMLFPALRNIPGKCVLCLISCLFVGQLCYLFVGFLSPVCFYQAALMHFSYLASFFWTNVLAYDICRTFMSTSKSTSGSRSKRFLYFSLYAWISPAIIVTICVMLDVLNVEEDFRPHYSEVICWISSRMSLLVFFVVPIAIILLVNIVCFIIAIHGICVASREAESAAPKTHAKGQLIVYIKLSLIMGLTWVFGLLASISNSTLLWYIFICLNSLQGLFLALVFICTKKVYNEMKAKWSTVLTRLSTQQNSGTQSTSIGEAASQKDKA